MQEDVARKDPSPSVQPEPPAGEEETVVKNPTEARQGVPVRSMRTVLFAGIALVILGFLAAGFFIASQYAD
jgi:hypothetical protein